MESWFLVKETESWGEEISWMQPTRRNGEMWWYSVSGSFRPEECITDFELLDSVEVERELDLDFSRTSMWARLKEQSKDTSVRTGWIERSGSFHRCGWHEHSAYAKYILGTTEDELVNGGWVKITSVSGSREPFWTMRDMGRMTPEQARKLTRLGFHVIEDDVTHG